MKIALALFLFNSLNLSFEYRESSPQTLFPYNYAVSDINPLGHLSNPACLPLWNAVYLNIDYAKPYMFSELNSGNLRAGYGGGNIAVQAAWNRFGIPEYSEDVFEINFGVRPCRLLSIGSGISYYHISISTEDINTKYGKADCKFSFLLFPFEWLEFGYLHENFYSFVNRDSEHNGSDEFIYPNQSLGLALKPARGITIAWNVNKVYYDYINTYSITANMLSCLSIKGGYSRETSTYSFSVNLVYDKFSVSYGMMHHSYLGSTHKFGLTIASGDLAFQEINYNKNLARRALPEKKKRININNCSLDEIKESNLFSSEIAERIIKYRNTMGPLSEKSLVQIGIERKELGNIREYISGLARDADYSGEKKSADTGAKFYRYKKTGYDIDTRKLLFRKLLENGINAATALEITELAKDNNKERLISKIEGSIGIDEQKKKIIIKTCSNILQ